MSRLSYDEKYTSVFKLMYRARRNILRDKREWLHPIEDVGVAFQDPSYENMTVVERLTYETIFLVLCAGLAPEPGLTMSTDKINEILSQNSLEELIEDLPEEEQRELRIDLEVLGLIPPDITKPQFAKN